MNGGRGEKGARRRGSAGERGIWPHALAGLAAALFTVVVLNLAAAVPGYANVAEPTGTPSPTVHIVDNSGGTVTVTVTGTWQWTTLKGLDSTHPCDSRFGVGWAMQWHDPNDHGYQLSTLSATVTVHVGSTGVIAANTDHKVSYDSTDPCGTFTLTNTPAAGDGTVSGKWTGTHTYASAASMPPAVCVVTFDLLANTTKTGPDPARLLFTNTDNSVADALAGGGTWDTTPGGANCTALSESSTTTTTDSTTTSTIPSTTTTSTTTTSTTTTTQPPSSQTTVPQQPSDTTGPVTSPATSPAVSSGSLAFTGFGPGSRLLTGGGVGLVVFGGGLLLTRRRRPLADSGS